MTVGLLPQELAAIEGLDRVAPYAAGDGIVHVARLAGKANLDPSTAALVAEAYRRRVPV